MRFQIRITKADSLSAAVIAKFHGLFVLVIARRHRICVGRMSNKTSARGEGFPSSEWSCRRPTLARELLTR
jgi:hypothetical protein